MSRLIASLLSQNDPITTLYVMSRLIISQKNGELQCTTKCCNALLRYVLYKPSQY